MEQLLHWVRWRTDIGQGLRVVWWDTTSQVTPLEPQDSISLAALAERAMQAADPATTADALAESWRAIDIALSPVIGPRGTLAIQTRSVHVAALSHPWLAALAREPLEAADGAALRLLVARQDHGDAVAGAQALLHAVIELLISLIGPSLTERLLRSVWTNALQDRS